MKPHIYKGIRMHRCFDIVIFVYTKGLLMITKISGKENKVDFQMHFKVS